MDEIPSWYPAFLETSDDMYEDHLKMMSKKELVRRYLDLQRHHAELESKVSALRLAFESLGVTTSDANAT